MVTLTRTSNTPYAVAYDHAPIRGIANEAKSIPREWINAHGNDIRQELHLSLPVNPGRGFSHLSKRCTGVYAGSSFKTRSRLIKRRVLWQNKQPL